jgi:hypothetical protein
MALSATFMKAILAMDSYNRGYNAGIKFGVLADNSDSAIGFYAIAYSYGGGKVVSYRGTDGILLDSVFGFPIGGVMPWEMSFSGLDSSV